MMKRILALVLSMSIMLSNLAPMTAFAQDDEIFVEDGAQVIYVDGQQEEAPAEPTATPEATAQPTPTVEPTQEPEQTEEPVEELVAPVDLDEDGEDVEEEEVVEEDAAEATPTPVPTAEPTATPEPTVVPTVEPTAEPTPEPTVEPTPEPTVVPTVEPTAEPTPTVAPTATPTVAPVLAPAPQAETLFDKLLAAETLEELNGLLNSDTAVFDLTTDEINALFDRVDALDPDGTNPITEEITDTLISLPNFTSGAEEDGEESFTYADTNWTGTIGAQTLNTTQTINLTAGSHWITGTIIVNGSAHVTIICDGNATIRRGSELTGPMFNIHNGSTLTIKGSNGAVITLQGNADKNYDGNNHSEQDQTMIRCDGGLNLEYVNLINNYTRITRDYTKTGTDATDDNFAGGAITICDNKNNNVSIKNCTFKDNTAKYGGAIYLCRTGGGTLTIENTVFDNCDAETSGGAIFFDGKPSTGQTVPAGSGSYGTGYLNYNVTLNNVTIQNCDSIGGCGSAIYMHDRGSANITMSGCTVQNCVSSAASCGTIRCDGNSSYKLTVDNCLIQNNESTGGHGAGIYWNALGTGASLVVKNSQILNNTASAQGGGMFVEGSSMSVTNTTISGNKALMGGGIGIKTFADTGFQDGATGTSFNLTLGEGVIIENNVATSKGAGISYNIVSGVPKTGFAFNYTNDGAIIRNNVVSSSGELTGTPSGIGGGIAIIDDMATEATTFPDREYTANTTIKAGTFSGNKAADGGAAHITVGDFEMSGGTVENHKVSGNGAGIYITGGNVKISGGTIQNSEAKNGAAVYMTNGSFEMTSGNLLNNTATENGGAVYVSGGEVTLSGGSLSDNTATLNGGAAYVAGTDAVKGNFTISGGTITDNTANGNGGGAYVSGGDFTMTGGTVQNNTAIKGGAVYVTGGNFNMISGSLLNNGSQESKVTEYGGAVYVDGGDITVGVEGCTGGTEGTKHTVKHTDKAHPIIKENKAQFGGAFAVRGSNNAAGDATSGIVTVYCSFIKDNQADNEGTGHNIFMDGGGLTHYLNSAEIGNSANHEIVTIGGQLQVVSDGQPVEIKLIYDADVSAITVNWEGKAPEGYHINLPYCPKDWQEEQAKPVNGNKAFVGWSKVPTTSTLVSEVRNKSSYLPIGTPIQVKDEGEKQMTFYAVWAPKVNNISYKYVLKPVTSPEQLISVNDLSEIGITVTDTEKYNTYTYENIGYSRNIPNPSKTGYTFAGWLVYADTTKISNWDADPVPAGTVSSAVTLLSQVPQPATAIWTGEIDRNFGDITLVAVFEEKTADISYSVRTFDHIGTEITATHPEVPGGETSATNYENVLVINGIPVSTATANPGFTFEGWYDAENNKVGNSEEFEPNRNSEGLHVDGSYYAKFVEKPAVINYVLIGPDGCGTLSLTSETIGMVIGEPTGSTANIVEPRYKFSGWFNNPECTGEYITISKEYVPTTEPNVLWSEISTYYAFAELNLTELTITANATPFNTDDSFVITLSGGGKNTKLVLQANETVVVPDVVVGDTYTITEETGWSWRYTCTEANPDAIVINENALQNVVTFVNNVTKTIWLDDASKREKIFNA